MSGAKRKTDDIAELRSEVAAAAKAADSARKTLAACARLDFSPAAFNKIAGLAGDAARLCRKESALASRLRGLHEQRIHEQEREIEELRLDKKRLSLLLRDALKIKAASGDPPKEDAKNEDKADDAADPPKKTGKKRGAPPGHRGATRRTPEKADHDHVIPPPEFWSSRRRNSATAVAARSLSKTISMTSSSRISCRSSRR